MHHTDYNTNLRQTQHKTMKNLSLRWARRTGDLRSAILAALLVLFALFQMDPANAQSTKTNTGFGTLQLGVLEQTSLNHPLQDQLTPAQTIMAQATDSSIELIVYNDTLTLIVDQTFTNPTTKMLTGDYVFALAQDAVVQAGLFSLGDHSQCKPAQYKSPIALTSTPNNKSQCHEFAITNSWTTLHSKRSNHALRVTTPPIASNQTLRVYLNIEFPAKLGDSPMSPLLPYSDDFSAEDHYSAEDRNSVSAAVDAMTANL